MDLHIKAYHLNHWLLSLYAFQFLYYPVTLSSRGWNLYFCVYSDLNVMQCTALNNPSAACTVFTAVTRLNPGSEIEQHSVKLNSLMKLLFVAPYYTI